MKKRSFLAIMMAGLLFASCDKTNDPNNNAGSGELETSYIAVSVNSVFDPAMRADGATYEDGTTEEQKVSRIEQPVEKHNQYLVKIKQNTQLGQRRNP